MPAEAYGWQAVVVDESEIPLASVRLEGDWTLAQLLAQIDKTPLIAHHLTSWRNRLVIRRLTRLAASDRAGQIVTSSKGE